jgi:ribonuclease HI
MREHPVIVFTDGAAKGNPGPGGWGVVIVTPDEHVMELGGGAPHTTNNRMELSGAIAALEHLARHPSGITVHTDSSYVIKGIGQWVWTWLRRGWKTTEGGDVLNRDLWEQLSSLVTARGRERIEWRWVKGHGGTPGNERVDHIAVAFSQERSEALYDGPLAGYPLAILDLPDISAPRPRSATPGSHRHTKAAAHSYLSVVDGVLMRHATWAECEGRVKGRSGARFKKAMNAADEAAILRAWGVEPTSVA